MAQGLVEREQLAPEAGPALYGLAAEFTQPEPVVEAARRAYQAGYRRMDAYTPLPVEGLSEALGFRDHLIPTIMLVAGITGFFFGFGLIFYCLIISYPMNVGGQPLFAWPIYVPITFECTVLFASLAGVLGMFGLNGLPEPYHPVFDAPGFERASIDRFFLCIESSDPSFDAEETRRFLEGLGAERVSEVELKD